MALSTELLKRLNSDEEPLPKRLKLAENAFYTVDIPVMHKEDLILQWLCEIYPVDQNVWSSLKHCLKTKHLDVKVDIKKLLIKTVIAKLQEQNVKNIHEDIFECCKLLVSNNGMQQYFINEPKYLGLLIESLLDYVLKLYKEGFDINEQSTIEIDLTLINRSDGLLLKAYNAAINVIENMMQIFKSPFLSKDNFRTIFIYHILCPLCVVVDHKYVDKTNRLGAAAYKCIQQIIFEKKYAQNRTYLKNEDTTRLTDLFSALAENAKTKDLQYNLITFTSLFHAAMGVFKFDSPVLDLILRELVKCAGKYEKQILDCLLKCLNDITFDFDNKVHGVTLFDYCQNVINNILSSENMTNIDYDLLTQFCSFNPLLIEKRIQDILRKAFLGNPTLEYINLLTSILDAIVHLRQEEKLISAILMALKHSMNYMSDAKFEMFFPYEFKEKFMKVVNNITNSQGVSMLRTLIYHLKVNCMEILQSNDTCQGKNILIMQATVELLITLLDGVCIFEYTGTLASHQKFVNALDDLGNVLSLLVDKALHLNHSKKIIVILLTAVLSWTEAQNALKYYVPKVITRDLTFPVSQDQWQQLIQRITNFGEDNCKNSMNKLILQQVKMSQNIVNESSIKFSNLIGGLEYSWYFILKFNPEAMLLLSNKEMSKVVHLLLTHMTSNTNNFNEWTKILHANRIQENKRFVISLLSCVIMQFGDLTTKGPMKSMAKDCSLRALLEIESSENEKIDEILMGIRDELFKDEWIPIEDVHIPKVKTLLEVLLHIPLTYLNINIKLITFMIIFALRKECTRNDEIISLCNTILSDLLEKTGLNTYRYIDPSLLLQELPQNRITQKSLELALRNNLSYTILKKLIKSSAHSQKSMYFLLESIEHIKSKLNTDQKAELKKAEIKLSKIMMKGLPPTITKIDDLKILNLLLKINIKSGIDEKLKCVTESTLHSIFMSDTDEDDKNELVQDGLQLVIVILRNRKIFLVADETIKGIWYALFKYPCMDVLLPLLESSEPKEFKEFLEYLHSQMIKILSNARESDLKNLCTIWDAILKTNMSVDRSKLRLTTIIKLFQIIQITNIPDNLWPILLKLVQSILAAKHLYLPGNVIDISIFLGLKSLQETTISTCNDALALCNILLKTRTSSITDRLPALLTLYRHTLSMVVHKSKVINNKSEEHMFQCLILDIEKFTSSLIKLKKDMSRLSAYLVADLLKLFSEPSIAIFVKASIQNCMNLLISICDQHGISLLSRTLPISMQEIFRSQLNVFNKFYKYSGKI
ncbi:uncharacterized protein LOC143186329 [Calliopsis andreniformis]|uniref:uncharacterized protein LOC143186329 n=1 Tax=Calliopsis andreniformis TaxID=337506 RepID=UPI003FCD3AB4